MDKDRFFDVISTSLGSTVVMDIILSFQQWALGSHACMKGLSLYREKSKK
jgi:hypothetical protein